MCFDNGPVFRWRPGVPVRLFRIRGAREKSTVFAICRWPNPFSNRLHADLTAPTNRAGTCTVCRLYVQVDRTVTLRRQARANHHTPSYCGIWCTKYSEKVSCTEANCCEGKPSSRPHLREFQRRNSAGWAGRRTSIRAQQILVFPIFLVDFLRRTL